MNFIQSPSWILRRCASSNITHRHHHNHPHHLLHHPHKTKTPPNLCTKPDPSPTTTPSKPNIQTPKPFNHGIPLKPLLDVDAQPLLHIIFVHPQIHWNTGNIGRTCLGLGARLHLIEPLGFSLSSKQVRRAGLDYWRSVDLVVHASFDKFVEDVLEEFEQVLFFSKFGEKSMLDVEFVRRGKIGLVFGSEVDGFEGIEKEVREIVGDGEGKGRGGRELVAFPMRGEDGFRAFNLSTTASMALWDAVRQLSR